MTRDLDSERGSASVFALVMALVLVLVALVVGTLGGLLAGQRRAAAAADLAALAAAQALQTPADVGPAGIGPEGGDPCAQARRVGSANGARVTGCLVTGLEVEVSVAVEVGGPLGLDVDVPGRARAGPMATGAAGPGP